VCIGNGMVALAYVNNCLFFAKNPKDIDQVVSELQHDTPDQKGLKLAAKDDVCTFLRVQIAPPSNGALELKQPKFIDEILTASCKVQNCNAKMTPLHTRASQDQCRRGGSQWIF